MCGRLFLELLLRLTISIAELEYSIIVSNTHRMLVEVIKNLLAYFVGLESKTQLSRGNKIYALDTYRTKPTPRLMPCSSFNTLVEVTLYSGNTLVKSAFSSCQSVKT